jgi:hypothetical protein
MEVSPQERSTEQIDNDGRQVSLPSSAFGARIRLDLDPSALACRKGQPDCMDGFPWVCHDAPIHHEQLANRFRTPTSRWVSR